VSKTIVIGFMTLALVLAFPGCGGGKNEGGASGSGSNASGGTKGAEASAPTKEVTLDQATAAMLKGKCTLKGAAPAMKEIDMGAKEAECLAGSPKKHEEWCVVGDGNTLANVVVFVKKGPALGVKSPPPADTVVIDQHNCTYTPHVVAFRVGQPVTIRSSDKTQHNVHLNSKLNGEWNMTMNEPSDLKLSDDKAIKVAEMPKDLRLKCDVHPWMGAYVGAFKHSYFFVTGKDGAFTLKDLPPGDYEIEAWHERFKSKPVSIKLGDKETKEITFEFAQ